MTQMKSEVRSIMQQRLLLTLMLPLLIGNVSIISFFSYVNGDHIAFFTPTGSYSHRVSMWPLVKKLVENGHHITFISIYPPKDPLPNVTELIPEQMAKYAHDYMQGGDLDITRRLSGDLEAGYNFGPRLGLHTCKLFLDDPSVQKWLQSEPKIDLFVVDWFLSECILGLAHKLNAPFIFYSPTVMVGMLYEIFGIVPDTAGIPDYEHHHSPPMTFWQRADNAIQPLIYKYKFIAYYEELGEVMRKGFNIPDMPPLDQIVRNASLMMWSESVIEGYAHMLPPNWITVGGMHCIENPEALPKDLEDIVAKGKDGFIYISFGSAVVPGNLPRGHLDAFFNAISEFPNIQFLWKWTGEMPKKIPKNLYIGKWFPQQSLLAHKRIVAFVTQAGRPSTQEAIFHAVPVIALPVFEDQDYTAERIRDMGGGIALEISTITKEQFQGALKDISTDPKYKKRMQRLSKIFRDQPMHPADKALYWTEYVLRHKGDLSHFRTSSYDLTWYERRHLDVWAVLFSAILVLVAILSYITLQLLKFLCKCVSPSANKHKQTSRRKENQKKTQ